MMILCDKCLHVFRLGADHVKPLSGRLVPAGSKNLLKLQLPDGWRAIETPDGGSMIVNCGCVPVGELPGEAQS